MENKENKKFSFSLLSCFSSAAMHKKERDRFEDEIQHSAARSGFKELNEMQSGQRVFKRDADGATVRMPKKEALRRSDKVMLHNFDGYL